MDLQYLLIYVFTFQSCLLQPSLGFGTKVFNANEAAGEIRKMDLEPDPPTTGSCSRCGTHRSARRRMRVINGVTRGPGTGVSRRDWRALRDGRQLKHWRAMPDGGWLSGLHLEEAPSVRHSCLRRAWNECLEYMLGNGSSMAAPAAIPEARALW